jgi:hypothetical protein
MQPINAKMTAIVTVEEWAEGLATEARYGPRFFESATGMRRGNPNPNHPDNWPLPSTVNAPAVLAGKLGSIVRVARARRRL